MVGGWLLKCLLRRGVYGTFEVGSEVCVWEKEPLRLDIFVRILGLGGWRWGGGGNLNCVALIDMRGGGLTFGFSKSGRSALLGVGP